MGKIITPGWGRGKEEKRGKKRNDSNDEERLEVRGSPSEVFEGVVPGDEHREGLTKGDVLFENSAEGGADDPIIVEGGMGEGIDVAGEDAPGECLIGSEEVGDGGKLAPEVEVAGIGVRGRMVLKAVGFNDGEEGPAEVGFRASGEGEGDDEAIGGEPEFGEEAGEAGAETGGINDEVAGVPFGTQVAEDGVERGVGGPLPAKAGDDAIERERWGGGMVGGNFDDGEGSEVVGGRGTGISSGDGGGRRGRRRGGSEERQAC